MLETGMHQDVDLYANSFQVHNNYVDQFLAYLSSDEWKVLTYAIRRITGFQKTQDRISISQFVNGCRDKEGKQLDIGTGLNKTTVCRALDELKTYGFVVEVAPNNPRKNNGACYALQFEYKKIDITGLKSRRYTKQVSNKEKGAKIQVSIRENKAKKKEATTNQQIGNVAIISDSTPPMGYDGNTHHMAYDASYGIGSLPVISDMTEPSYGIGSTHHMAYDRPILSHRNTENQRKIRRKILR